MDARRPDGRYGDSFLIQFRGSQIRISRSAIPFRFGQLGIAFSMLQSVFVAGGSLALLGGVAFLCFGFLGESSRVRTQILYAAGATFGAFILSLSSTTPLDHMARVAIGMFLFLTTLIAAPTALVEIYRRRSNVLLWLGWGIILPFLLEYTGVFSLKSVGIVSWYETNYFVAVVDERPSGLYSEPSWHALAAGSLACALLKRPTFGAILTTATLICTLLLSGSSIGVLLLLIIILKALVQLIRSGRYPFHRFITAIVIVGIGVITLPIVFLLYSESSAVQKLLSPLENGSGSARFSDPWMFIYEVWDRSPFLGMGMSYITENLLGLSGFAVLPMNVFIEMGFVGLAIYSWFLFAGIWENRSSLLDLAGSTICLISLGLPYSPFQAVMLAYFIVGTVK